VGFPGHQEADREIDARRRLLLAAGAGLLAGCAARIAPREGVPRDFQRLYGELEKLMADFDASLSREPARRREIVLGGEVLAANAHRGEELLSEQAFRGSLVYMESLKALGAGGVTIQAAYPLLAEGYPRSAEYWAFYRRLAQAARGRNLKLHIKNGPLFTEREFTKVAPDYSQLTPERNFEARTRIAQRAAAELAPDWLTIGNEPSSEMHILKFAIPAERYTRFVNDTLRGMQRGRTLVGAGSGNWDSLDYIRRFSNETALDYIDLHIYPLAGPRDNYLQRALEMARIARAAGKRVLVGEAWLYKAAPRELGANPTAASVFARDVYSFWAPLDVRFLGLLHRFAQTQQAEYLSPFWTKYLFSYVDFDAAPARASARELLELGDRAAVKQIVAGKVSESGEAYRRIARRD
jgi:hypothetical protein